jgi:hypothetical protein
MLAADLSGGFSTTDGSLGTSGYVPFSAAGHPSHTRQPDCHEDDIVVFIEPVTKLIELSMAEFLRRSTRSPSCLPCFLLRRGAGRASAPAASTTAMLGRG